MARPVGKYHNQEGNEMTMRTPSVDTIAFYGSRVRADDDCLSDRDILLVDNDLEVLLNAARHFTLRGYSCGTYTWKRLELMSARGALFLQHLKDESLILQDRGNRLALLLNRFTPKPDYSEDIEATRRVVALTELTAAHPASRGWALDVLAVAVRNLGILTLASRGVYTFSYQQILERLSEYDLISNEAVDLLRGLRHFKYLYRQGIYNALPDTCGLQAIQRTVGMVFSIDMDSKGIEDDSFIACCLSKARKESENYRRFRLIEGAITTYLALRSTEHLQEASKFSYIVKNQNQYGLYCRDISKPLLSIADDIMHPSWSQKAHPLYRKHSGVRSMSVM